MDELGAPFCVTLDRETLDAGTPTAQTATLRDRDSKAQERVGLDALVVQLAASRVPPAPAPLEVDT